MEIHRETETGKSSQRCCSVSSAPEILTRTRASSQNQENSKGLTFFCGILIRISFVFHRRKTGLFKKLKTIRLFNTIKILFLLFNMISLHQSFQVKQWDLEQLRTFVQFWNNPLLFLFSSFIVFSSKAAVLKINNKILYYFISNIPSGASFENFSALRSLYEDLLCFSSCLSYKSSVPEKILKSIYEVHKTWLSFSFSKNDKC